MRTTTLSIIASLVLAPLALAQITIYPGASGIPKGTTRQMSAYVPLSPNTVTWAINDTVGGSATYGIVTSTGKYTAPALIPPDNQITIKVTSTADATKFSTAQISITQPLVYIWGSYPNTVTPGAISLSINGAGFVPGAVITINDQPLSTAYLSPTALKVTGNVPASMLGVAKLKAINPGPGSTISDPVNLTVKSSAVSLSISPSSINLPINASQAFTATVTGSANTAVTWSTNVGTISAAGLYTAPAALPNPPTATVTATSVADPLVAVSAVVTLNQPAVTVTVSPASAQLFLNGTQQLTATVVGNANTAVTWSASAGTITPAGLYTAPGAMPNPASATITAASVAAPAALGKAFITIKLAPPAMPNLSHARFLDQAAFGPTSAELQNLGQMGIDAWLANQFNLPASPIAIPATNNLAQSQYLNRIVNAPDQLRQRVIAALNKIIVVSAQKNPYSEEVVPYLQILSKHAFGSYRQLLSDITLSPQMGKYLDLANSKPPAANENYPRELMQLFSTGLVLLNSDGTPQLDAQNNTIPTYNQTVVAQTALALTGWTYPTAPGGTPNVSNWENFSAPAMEAREQFHNKSAKTIIGGCPIPAGLTVAVETNAVLDCVFNHPNTAPFIVTRLIRDLVTSNPSPAYVQRVVDVWNTNGPAGKGDLKAVVTAILKDAEARQDQASVNQGRLKDPVYHIAAFLRAMNGNITPDNLRGWNFFQLGQAPLAPASVFGAYSLTYRIRGGALAGPEFQIYTPTESMLRGNFIHEMLTNPNQSDLTINLGPFLALAADKSAVIEQVNATLLYGRMPQSLKNSLATAMAAAYDNNQAVITALYLTALSGYYTVQY